MLCITHCNNGILFRQTDRQLLQHNIFIQSWQWSHTLTLHLLFISSKVEHLVWTSTVHEHSTEQQKHAHCSTTNTSHYIQNRWPSYGTICI